MKKPEWKLYAAELVSNQLKHTFMNEAIKELNSYINRYQRGCRMEKVTKRTYTIVACKSSQAAIAKKAIMLNLKVKFVNAYDVFRSMQVYY